MKISWVNTIYETRLDDGSYYQRFGRSDNFEWVKVVYDGEYVEIFEDYQNELEKLFQEYMKNKEQKCPKI